MVLNSALIFIKPHANVSDKARETVKKTLEAQSIKVTSEGQISGEEIDKKQLIDNHYYAIASKATILKPSELNVPKKMFSDKFPGKDWDTELAAGNILNAMDACKEFDCDADCLNTCYSAAKSAGRLVKFGGGFYCGDVECKGKRKFVMNGFFMSMRSAFVAPGSSIYYYVVEWDSKNCNWENFRANVIGPTDPVTAPAESLRGIFYSNWKELGLDSLPNTGNNAIHASASPFEALAEKCNWLGTKPEDDVIFGKPLLKYVDMKTFNIWAKDATITYGVSKIKAGVFDSVEDMDSDECLNKLTMMYSQREECVKEFTTFCEKMKGLSLGA